VRLPYNYLTRADWYDHFGRSGVTVRRWDREVHLYPRPLSAVFGRGLHVLIDLGSAPSTSTIVDMVDPGT
jgi:hypothetical protein